jgi:hypothetical protein
VALTRYVVTAQVTLPQGTVIITPTAGEPGTGGAAGYGNVGISAGYGAFPQTIVAGQVIEFDPATTAGAALQAAIRDRGPARARPGLGRRRARQSE